jgi:cellulose synthase/poly-beta-1,6-N-acetylglucosamine synthase-like glycosyltransferase
MSVAFYYIALFCLLSLIVYLVLMIYYHNGLSHLVVPLNQQTSPSTLITVVVCFRNEEQQLTHLLKSLVHQTYPADLFEIILYNDASKDGSLAVIKNFVSNYPDYSIICKDVPSLAGANSAKKLAINEAVNQSKAELMVVTDADCILQKDWLLLIENCFKQQNFLMINGPVAIERNNSWFNELQYLELQSLAAVSAGAIGQKNPIMCNGANLAFHRKTFLTLNPYQNNYHISSGDDTFLMNAMHKNYPQKITFLVHPSSIVLTHAKLTLIEYFHQRVRWASKSKSYANFAVKLVALLVLNGNLILLFAPLFLFIAPLNLALIFIFSLLMIKQAADLLIQITYSNKINSKVNYMKLFIFQYLEALFTVIVAIKSIKGTYTWKERKQYF